MTQDNSPLTDLTYLTYKTKPTAERFVVGKKKEVKIMNDLISKSKVLKWLEIQIADCSRELKRDLFAEDLVTVSERLDTLKKVYDNIKDVTPLQLADYADRAEDYTKREIETAVKNNCLTIRLNLAYAEIESLKQKYNEALKAQSKQEWISCDDRLPETDGYYLVYGAEHDFFSGEKIPYCGILQYLLKYKVWNTKSPINVTHWQSLPESPYGAEMKRGKENE